MKRSLHICMITSSLDIGGAETHIITLSRQLAKLGHKVTIISSGGSLVAPFPGIRHLTLPLNDKKEFFFCLLVLRAHFKHAHYDVIHTHARYPAFLCRLCGASPLVSTAHWPFYTGHLLGKLPVWGKKILAVSPDIAAYLGSEYHIPEKDILLTVNGIDTDFFSSLPNVFDNTTGLCLCHASRFDADRSKVAFALIGILPSLAFLRPTLHLVGDGSEMERIRVQANITNKKFGRAAIILHGRQTDIRPMIAKAHLFVGVSRAALEAMAMARPVIVAGDEGLLGLFEPNVAEFAAKSNFCCRGASPFTRQGLRMAILDLVKRPKAEIAQMCYFNRAYVEKNYTPHRMATDALQAYQAVLHTKSALLCGYYGFGNIGDEWLAKAGKEHLRSMGYRHVFLLSKKKCSRAALSALLSGEDLYLGGGNLLQDGSSRRSLLFYLAVCRTAICFGGKLYMIGAGLGPLSEWGEEKIRALLPCFQKLEARSEKDYDTMQSLCPKSSVKLGCDMSLRISFSIRKSTADTIFIIPSVHLLSHASVYAVERYLSRLVRAFPTEKRLLLAFHTSDIPLVKQLSSRLAIPFYLPCADEMTRLFSNARLTVTSRLHGAIGALSSGVPSLIWNDGGKNLAFYSDVKKTAERLGLVSPVSLWPSDVSHFCFSDQNTADILRIRQAILARGGE